MINIRFKANTRVINTNKKRGFTLIEMIAVIAIIGILSTILIPKISGYIKEAKKTKVIDQCRKVVMAVESYNLRYDVPLKGNISVSNVTSNLGVKKYLDGVNLNNINYNSTTLQNCYDILEGAEFEFVEDTETLNPTTIKFIKSDTGNTKNNN